MAESRREYEQRMHRVQRYIDEHLDGHLDLATLADVAHFSAFHFHRLFSAWMGETLGDYLRRRRVETAAMRLIARPDEPVLDIALSVGFGSAEAFARAFKLRFGCTASEWRKQHVAERAAKLEAARASGRDSNPGQAKRNLSQAPDGAAVDHGGTPQQTELPMDVKIIDRQPVKIAYLRYEGPYGAALGLFWQDTVAPWMGQHNLFGRPRYGISHDDPDIVATGKCRYDACVEVEEGYKPTGKALVTTIPGGKYAMTPFFGTSQEIGPVWEAMLRDWLPASGMQLDARPFFEYYAVDARFDPKSGKFGCDICIPVTDI